MAPSPGQVGGTPRWHAAVAHTADVGVRATAPDPRGLLEEAAAALAELSADVSQAKRRRPEAIEVRADDLPALTFAWLNELVGLADARGEALVEARVEDLESTPDGWLARGTAGFAAYDADVRPRLQVKAATFHRLKVAREGEGWALEAYFDV
jgi:SHS2 domain-containing protein